MKVQEAPVTKRRGPNDPTTASGRLRYKIELASVRYALAARRLLDHRQLREVIREYLFMMHGVIRTTVPLMEAAIARAEAMAEDDAVAAGVGAYLRQHVEEERDHDEWLLEDLGVLGMDRTTVRTRVPTPTVAALGGSQYYWALHHHPVSLMGYFAFMEGDPPTPALIEDLIARTGYPPEAFRTLAKHGELDPGHSEEIDAVIDSLPLTRAHETAAGLSAMASADLLAHAMEEILGAFPVAG